MKPRFLWTRLADGSCLQIMLARKLADPSFGVDGRAKQIDHGCAQPQLAGKCIEVCKGANAMSVCRTDLRLSCAF
jgi:hypothetical protein